MKKIFGIILIIICCLGVTSCSSSESTTSNIVDPGSQTGTEETEQTKKVKEIKAKLGLDNLTVSLNSADTTEPSYENVLVASDVNSSLFTYYVSLDSIFEGNRVVSTNISCLTFVDGISSDYQSSLYNILKNGDYNLTTILGVSFETSVESWTVSYDLTSAKDAYESGTRDQVLAIIYLPLHYTVVSTTEGKQNTPLDISVLVPIYYNVTTYTNDVFADSNITTTNVYTSADLAIKSGSKLLASDYETE